MDAPSIRCFLEIEKNDSGRYQGRLRRGDSGETHLLPDLDLGPLAKITIRNGNHTLGDLIRALIAFKKDVLQNVFDERGQLELGRHLYEQTLGRWPHVPAVTEGEVQLRIVAEDEHVLRLPWVLLACGGRFLCMEGWSVVLGRPGDRLEDCPLPPSPKMLVAIPQPGVPGTEADAHLEELEERLARADRHFYRGHHLQVARSLEELRALCQAGSYDVFYYYGHGIGDAERTRLVFATAGGERRDLPVADLATELNLPGCCPRR